MSIKNQHNVVVIGAARSGIAAACMLRNKGYQVFVTDAGPITETHKNRLQQHKIPFEEKGHTEKALQADFAVVSPGVPTSAPVVREYLDSSRSVFSEIEMAFRFTSGNVIAVTGSNGKTTVTNWLDFIWQNAGRAHVTAGNIGKAYSDIVDCTADDTDTILEVSSFQLDHILTFRPDISLLLNITPDHLDRYNNSFEAYAASKFRIFENQTADDQLVFNYDDPVISKRIKKLKSESDAPRLLPFSTQHILKEGAYIKENKIMITIKNSEETLMHTSEVGLSGKHNLKNGLAAALAARAAEISSDVIRNSLKRFEGVEHRLEFVREMEGVRYINDSKATNINAVWYALDSLKTPAVLILGGRDKGNDYTELHRLLYEKVHTVIAIGESRHKIKEQVSGICRTIVADSFDEAIHLAQKSARRGDTVLLSTACSSFDMFENYEHRGREFKKLVRQLS